MSVSTKPGVTVSAPDSSTISLDELAFLSASLFLVGSCISFYIAYKNLKSSGPTTDSVIQTFL